MQMVDINAPDVQSVHFLERRPFCSIEKRLLLPQAPAMQRLPSFFFLSYLLLLFHTLDSSQNRRIMASVSVDANLAAVIFPLIYLFQLQTLVKSSSRAPRELIAVKE